jgi:glutamate-1-semialdehyde 2,1-aminomutase
LRINYGGAQKFLGVTPDLTCLGKIIGGGLPVGGVGGRADLMQLFSPDNARPVMHASTFSGNALTMSAGLPAMQAFNEDECNRINVLADKLRDGFNQAFAQAGILGNASGIGSLTNINFSEKPLNDSRDYLDGLLVSKHIGQLLHLGMLRHGVNSASRLMFCTSTAMSDREIEKTVAALHATLDELKPFVETECPELIL